METQSDASRVFTLFPKLVPELREKIWVHTVDWRPHVVPRPPITELAVCHEARSVLLKIYRPCFCPVKGYRKDDTSMSSGSGRGERWIMFRGMGHTVPRSPYANFETDVLHLKEVILREITQEESPLTKFLTPEAIEKTKHVLILVNHWSPRPLGGPARHNGQPPPRPRADKRLILSQFGALKTLTLAEEPSLKVDIAPLSVSQRQDQTSQNPASRSRILYPHGELIQLEQAALRKRFSEGKIVVPTQKPAGKLANPFFKFEAAQPWIDMRAQEWTNWNPPKVQFATIIMDPET